MRSFLSTIAGRNLLVVFLVRIRFRSHSLSDFPFVRSVLVSKINSSDPLRWDYSMPTLMMLVLANAPVRITANLSSATKQKTGWEHLLIFVSCEAADEWWRVISTPPSPYAGTIIRNSPQLYTYNNAQNRDIRNFYNAGSPDVERFYRKIVHIRRLSDIVTIPSIAITDHISGRW